MEPDRTPLAKELTTKEDNRSQNTRITHQLDRSSEEDRVEDSNEVQEQFDVEKHLEDDTGSYEIVDAVDVGLKENGVPKGENGSGKVEEFLIDQLGYDPDVEDYATFGDVNVQYGNGFIDVFYEVGDNLSSPRELNTPVIQSTEPEVIEHSIAADVPHASTASYERDGKNVVQFRYRETDWIIATEEVGDAITEFEEDVELSSYSGR